MKENNLENKTASVKKITKEERWRRHWLRKYAEEDKSNHVETYGLLAVETLRDFYDEDVHFVPGSFGEDLALAAMQEFSAQENLRLQKKLSEKDEVISDLNAELVARNLEIEELWGDLEEAETKINDYAAANDLLKDDCKELRSRADESAAGEWVNVYEDDEGRFISDESYKTHLEAFRHRDNLSGYLGTYLLSTLPKKSPEVSQENPNNQ